jgi:hypothetical protein
MKCVNIGLSGSAVGHPGTLAGIVPRLVGGEVWAIADGAIAKPRMNAITSKTRQL